MNMTSRPDCPNLVFILPDRQRRDSMACYVCDGCGGQVKIVAAVTDPGSIRRYLEGDGLPPRAPPIAPPRPHPQREFDMDYAASAA